ncbi:MAG: DNA topoisomerase I [Nanoarchaeota archaeon]
MAPVESFLPATSEPKQTVEKTVRQKPSVAELTTIESPGRPIPANEFDQDERKKSRKKPARPKKEPARIKEKKETPVKLNGDAILILTEKPQAALKIASALGNAHKYSENNVPFYELQRNGKTIIVASAVGHLFNLAQSKGQTGWPIFAMEWVPAFQKTAFTKRYYDVIKRLASRTKEIMVATDYDIEGEVIGWNIVRFLLHQKDAKRMKFSTLTKPELEKAYEHPLPTIDWGQAYAGETRHQIDWLYGINLSRALMAAIKRTGAFKILSIGRIQGPALKIIVDREKEIAAFTSVPYWNVFAHIGEQTFKHPKDIFEEKQLKAFENIREAVAETTKREEHVEPPHPFDLTTLQREAYAWHKIAPARTLQVAQALYLDSLISYPRTSSQKIPQEIGPKEILKKLEKTFPEARKASRPQPVEGPKSDPAHPSIYPTGEIASLEGDEKKVYELIVKRFISAFSDNALLARKNVTLIAGDKTFTANGTKIIKKGWMHVYPSLTAESELEDYAGKVAIDKITFEKKETQPPKRYTPTSLITLLEKKNLGTKTTRSMIVETLFDRGYLEGTSIKATPLGIKLIEALEKHSPIIINEELTQDLEKKMEDLQITKENRAEKEKEIIAHVEKIITDIAHGFKAHELEIGKALQEGNIELREIQKEQGKIMPCPVCKTGTLSIRYSKKIGRYFVACDQYPACKTTFSLPPNALIKKTEKVSENGLPLLMALRKGKKPWIFEFNPHYKTQQTGSSNSDR